MAAKTCHRSFSIIESAKSALIGGKVPTVQVAKFPCLGMECSLFVPDMDENGNVKKEPNGAIVGMCGDTVAAISAARQATIMEMQFAEDHEAQEEETTPPGKGN